MASVAKHKDTILIQSPLLTLVVKSVADPEAIHLLRQTVYGTNGLRYRQTGQEYKMYQLNNPYFFHLYVEGHLQGFYCLDQRQVTCQWGNVNSFYGRYLAVSEAYQRRGYGRLLKSEAINYIERTISTPYLLYSYIEEKNVRSLALAKENGFQSISQLKTFVFRRLSPVADSRVNRLPGTDSGIVTTLLDNQYADYNFRLFAKVGEHGNYFGIKDGSKLIAGVQANRVSWEFLAMPATTGWIMMNILPKLPWLNRLFQPRYSFLALDGIYLKPVNKEVFIQLLESVLAYSKLNSALFQIDSRDRLFPLLSHMGVFSGFQKGITTHVLVKPYGLTADQVEQVCNSPAYLISFDYT